MAKSILEQTIANLRLKEEEANAQNAADQLGLAYVSLTSYPIAQDVLYLISQEQAVEYHVVAYLRVENELKVATYLPPTAELNNFLTNLATQKNITIKLTYCSRMSYDYGITLYLFYKEVDEEKKRLAEEKENDFSDVITSIKDIDKLLKEVSATKLIDLIFSGAVLTNASDIHIEPGDKSTRLRFRIDGILQDVSQLSKQQFEALRSRIKNLAQLKIDIVGAPQDGRFEMKAARHVIDVRVSTLPASYGEDIVMRILLQDVSFLKIDELGFNPTALALVKEAISQPHGMILNTGPTGSGKTTTLYAILSAINKPGAKVITIEDPVEYRLPGINQIQVNPETGLTFESALRGAMRQDPDIIMIGEIRDAQTAKIALQAALTGHLVLSTLHTNSAPAAIPRLLEIGIEPYLLAGSINLIIGQRLVRRVCPTCRGKDANCPTCLGVKYKGRIPIIEALKPSEEFNTLIGRKATIDEFERKAKALGMETMLEDGLSKIAAGLTTQEEVERVAQETGD
jgi:type II secretory ATPase GspE/PulE/Tfp pilus assembly ATPase PilB-like protein